MKILNILILTLVNNKINHQKMNKEKRKFLRKLILLSEHKCSKCSGNLLEILYPEFVSKVGGTTHFYLCRVCLSQFNKEFKEEKFLRDFDTNDEMQRKADQAQDDYYNSLADEHSK